MGRWCPVGLMIFLAGQALLGEQSRTYSLRTHRLGVGTRAGAAPVLCRSLAYGQPRPNAYPLRPVVLAIGHSDLDQGH